MGVEGGVGGGLLPVLLGGGKRLSEGLGGGARCGLLKLLATSNSLLILTALSGVDSITAEDGDGGVAGGGLLNMHPSEPRASNTPPPPPPPPPSWDGGDDSSYSSFKTTPDVDDDDEDDAPAGGAVGGVGGVDDESKKLKLKSEVVSKLTSVVTWWWRLDSVTRDPDPKPPIDWSILNTSIFRALFSS